MIVSCEICGKKIKRKPSEILNHSFCSRDCFVFYRKNFEVRAINRKLNKYKELNDYIVIYIDQNKEVIIDKEDFEKINNYTWRFGAKGYAVSSKMKNSKNHIILMHRLIMNAPNGMVVDHINHNTLDNRKSNLRICTTSQNVMNSKTHKGSRSRARGVDYHKRDKLWRARIMVKGKRISIGWFKTEEEAIDARLKAEKIYFGEYSYQCNQMGGRIYED